MSMYIEPLGLSYIPVSQKKKVGLFMIISKYKTEKLILDK